MDKETDMEFGNQQKIAEIFMKVNTKMIKSMDMEYISGSMDQFMRAISKMI